MSRYVDADALDLPYGYCEDASECYKALSSLPSIDIVRCGECKRANHELSGVYCGISDVFMGEDGFCSIGEREGE